MKIILASIVASEGVWRIHRSKTKRRLLLITEMSFIFNVRLKLGVRIGHELVVFHSIIRKVPFAEISELSKSTKTSNVSPTV